MTNPTATAAAVTNSLTAGRALIATSPDDPGAVTAAYTRMIPRWTKMRALMAGTEAMVAGGEDFLPRLEGETDDGYEARQLMAALFPGFSRTVRASVGMLFQQPPTFEEDMPPVLEDLAENIDGEGSHWTVFASKLATEAIVDGYAGILVEHLRPDQVTPNGAVSAAAQAGRQLSIADEQALGLRPLWIRVRADDVTKQIHETINGRRVLTVLVIRRFVERRVGRFGVQGVVQYRAYENAGGRGIITCQTFTEQGGIRREDGPPVVLKNAKRIPWSPLVTGDELNELEVQPPLTSLADLNVEHWQVKSNMRNLETLGCVPTPVRVGATPNGEGEYPPITLGPRNTVEAPYQQGVSQPFYWTSPDVSVLEPARKSLDALEAAMAREGGAFLAPDPAGVETADAKRIKGAAQRATLSTVAQALQDCLELAFQLTADYLNGTAGSVLVNRDFESPLMDAATMSVYIDAVDRAGLPAEILVRAWIKGGRLPEETDVEALVEEMLAAAAAKREQEAQAARDRANAMLRSGAMPPNGKGAPDANQDGAA